MVSDDIEDVLVVIENRIEVVEEVWVKERVLT